MTRLSLLAAATGAPDDQAAIAVAADLAKRHQSIALIVTFAAAPVLAAAPVFTGAAMAAQLWESIDERQRDIRARVGALVRADEIRLGLPHDAEGGVGLMLAPSAESGWATLMRELPLVDFAVVAQSSVTGGGPWAGPLGEALMEGRAPVYVARDAQAAAGRPAAVAWDGSLEAGRAVRAALPLLQDASEVAILQDPDGLDTSPHAAADPARLVGFFRQRGVAAEKVIQVRGRKIGPTLMQAACDFGAGLLVAGAYRHSRLGEAIFGGATHSFLAEARGPHLLISH